MKNKPKIVAIIGPTASGKSDLAVKIAREYNGEIVSADSRQIYKGMDVGTAKPRQISNLKSQISKRGFFSGGIKHHLIDIKNPDEDYSAGQYKKDAIKAINEIIKKGKLPILVGGTGLYISAIINNWDIPEIKENKKLSKKLEKEIQKKGLAFVFKKLLKLDPEAAHIIDSKNPRRVIRALEIAILSGKKFSEQRKKGKPLYDVLEIGLNPLPQTLELRNKLRNKIMIKRGLVKEVKKLTKKYGYRQKAFNTIGYKEIIDYLRGQVSLQEAIDEINKNTLRYAKRQLTWFKKYNPKAHWINPPAGGLKEAEKLVKKFLNGSWRN